MQSRLAFVHYSFEKELAAVEGGDQPASGDASPAPRGSDDEGANEPAPEGEVGRLAQAGA